MNPEALASKLAELAEGHDVTVEVPAVSWLGCGGQARQRRGRRAAASAWRAPHASSTSTASSPLTPLLHPSNNLQDFFFKSPATAKDGLRVTLTPKSAKAKTPAAGAPQDAAPASARTAGRSRLSQVGGATPVGAAPGQPGAELERTQEVAVPAEVLEAAAARAASSAKKQPPSASRRRSLSRTPGTKIVIVERGTPKSAPGSAAAGGPASAKRGAASQVLGAC